MILLLHALPLQAAMWDEQLRWFGERHRVMAPDLKGFGGSDAPAYSVESSTASSGTGSPPKATFSC